MSKLDDKLREILDEDRPPSDESRIDLIKQAIADKIRACEPEKKDIPEQTHQTVRGSLERLATQHEAIGYNKAISEYTENLTKKGLLWAS